MAEKNPYDQFNGPVTPVVNPYDQFNGTPTPAKRSYSAMEVPGNAIMNLPGSTQNFVGGMVTAVQHPRQSAGVINDILSGFGQMALGSRKDGDPQEQARQIATAKAVLQMYDERYGGKDLAEKWDNWKRTMGEDPVGFAADLATLIGGGAGAVRIGANAVGATKTAQTATRVGDALTRGQRIKGVPVPGLTSPMRLVEAPVWAAGKGVDFAYNNMLDPKGAMIRSAAEDKGPQLLNALNRTDLEVVPGSVPTAAEAAASVGATRFSALGAAAEKKLPSDYAKIRREQKRAQKAQARTVGKTEGDLTAAEGLRDTTAKSNYGTAKAQALDTDDFFNDLLERPSMSKVIKRAKDLAAERDTTFQVGTTKKAGTAPSGLVDASGRPIMVPVPAQYASLPGTSVHWMKKSFDDLIKNPERFGIGAEEVKAIRATRDEFINWYEGQDKIPAFKTARETYTKQSKPITRMQVGQYIERKLKKALKKESPESRAAAYTNVLEHPKTVERATGQSFLGSLKQNLEPDELAALKSIETDLDRSALNSTNAKLARGSGPDLGKSGTEAIGNLRAPNYINAISAIANQVFRALQGKVNEATAIEVAMEMRQAATMRAPLKKALGRKDNLANRAGRVVKDGAQVVSDAIHQPAIYNVLSPDQQEQRKNMLSGPR